MDNIKFKSHNFFDRMQMSKEEKVEIRKQYSFFKSQASERSKPKKCLICGKECTSFCKSHTIPQFVLKKIDSDGELVLGTSFYNIPFLKENVGIKKTLLFNIICDECDNTKFQDYENPKAYSSVITKEMLRQIALKNCLSMYGKRLIELNQYLLAIESYKEDELMDTTSKTINVLSNIIPNILVTKQDLKDYDKDIKNILRNKTEYYLIDEIELDYVIPIAYQGCVNLISGFENELINNVYNKNPKYRLQGLHIAIFPLEKTSKIILFTEYGNNRLRSFYKPYKKLPLEKKLYCINYIIIQYTEDYVINPKYLEKIKLNEETINLIKKSSIPYFEEDELSSIDDYEKEVLETAKKHFCLKTEGNIYDFLKNME